MKIVAVTACPTSVAWTYMVAARLEETATNLGHEIKVEMQSALGTENSLSDNDIRQAQVAIFASDIRIEGRERFQGLRIMEVSLEEAINNTRVVFEKLTG